jgi:hypothetical protein
LTPAALLTILYIRTVFSIMETPAPPHIVHRYRYFDTRKNRWKETKHRMSAEEAAKFFAPGMSTHFTAERWEPIESSREVVEGVPMHGKGIDCRLPKREPPPSERRPGRLTVDEIRAIWERNKSTEVRHLMWEIWYLRGTVQLARYVATVADVAGIDPAFADRLRDLDTVLKNHPTPEPLRWTTAEEAALKRIAKARR